MVTSDGGSRMGKPVLYKALVDESIRLSQFPPKSVLIFRRGLDTNMPVVSGRDVDWAGLAAEHAGAQVPGGEHGRGHALVDRGVLEPDERVELLDGIVVAMPPGAALKKRRTSDSGACLTTSQRSSASPSVRV